MIPIELTLENYTCHTLSVIDFTQFSSAVILGQGENNTRRSNGVGKSKIFGGINYAVYNQSSFNNIENVIRDGADKCRVTYIFKMDTDTYKIERSRGRKAGSADIRFFKKNEADWDDLTERTPSQTEKAIQKVVKINYQTFTNSIYFGQGDLSGLAILSPTDRKKLLKEVMQLHVYSALEKVTKKRLSALNDSIRDSNAIMSTFQGLEDKSTQLSEELNKTELEIKIAESAQQIEQDKIINLDDQLVQIIDRGNVLKIEHDTITQKVAELTGITTALISSKNQSLTLRGDLKNEFQKKKGELLEAHNVLKDLQVKNLPESGPLAKEQEELSKEIIEKSAQIRSNQIKIKESNIRLPDGPQCDTCLQSIPEQHRAACQAKAEEKITNLQQQNAALTIEVGFLRDKQKLLQAQIELSVQHQRDVLLSTKDIQRKETELEAIKNKYQSFDRKFKEFEEQVITKETELSDWKTSQDLFIRDKMNEYNQINSKVTGLQQEKNKVQFELRSKSDVVSRGRIQWGILNDRIIKNAEDTIKKSELKKKLLELEDSSNLHQSVAQAFGTKGIPALIIHNMLDDLQVYANNTIQQIKPGLQLEFEIDKENSKGEQTDTLNIKYSLNNKEREYDQLSGAQRLVVTLGLRLGLSQVIQKSLGIDLKFLMLDEVDASLDEEGLDSFIDLIKVIEKDFKVLVITHNNSLKSKFSHAILVEQDQNMNSVAKLVSW